MSIFAALRMIIRNMFNIIGVALPNGDLYSWQQKLVVTIKLLALIGQVNGLISVWPNSAELCKSIILYMLGVQAVTKGISRLIKDDEKSFYEMNKIIDKFYEENEKCEKFRQILASNVEVFKRFVMGYLTAFFIIFHLPAATGWIMPLITGELKLLIPLKYPFIDSNTIFGFLFYQTFTTVLSTTFFLIISAGDAYNTYLTLQAISMVDIFNSKIDQLGKDLLKVQELKANIQSLINELKKLYCIKNWLQSRNNSKLTIHSKIKELETAKTRVEKQFINLINDHQLYNYYVSRILSHREVFTFTTLYINFIGIGLSFVAIKYSSIAFGIAVCTIFSLQVFMHCFECTLVTIQNEKLLTAVQEFPWYELSNRQRKIFQQFLCICQSTKSFSLPIFGDVDMELFTDIMQAAYSFLMYIIQFVNVK